MGASSEAWETRVRWRVEASFKEPGDFPVGALRAATRICLEDEIHAKPALLALDLRLSLKDEKIRSIAKSGSEGAVPPELVPCLQKLYAKLKFAKAPETLSLSLRLAPAE